MNKIIGIFFSILLFLIFFGKSIGAPYFDQFNSSGCDGCDAYECVRDCINQITWFFEGAPCDEVNDMSFLIHYTGNACKVESYLIIRNTNGKTYLDDGSSGFSEHEQDQSNPHKWYRNSPLIDPITSDDVNSEFDVSNSYFAMKICKENFNCDENYEQARVNPGVILNENIFNYGFSKDNCVFAMTLTIDDSHLVEAYCDDCCGQTTGI